MIDNTSDGPTERPSWLARVETIANQVAENEGCRIYDIEFSSNVLRVFIEKEAGSNDPDSDLGKNATGAGIKDCENVSRGLSEILDTEDVVPSEHYQLEVSTPGLERTLKKDWHYKTVIGKKVKLRTQQSLESLGITVNQLKNAKSLVAELVRVEGQDLFFKVEGSEVKIPFDAIERARVLFEFSKADSKKKEHKFDKKNKKQ
jgi:ribosome maturation factor RimP